MSSKILKSVACFIASAIFSNYAAFAQPFSLSGVSDLYRVFEDGHKLSVTSDTIKVFGLRGETISGQLAINAKTKLTDVVAVVSPLIKKGNAAAFPLKNIEWNFVGSVFLPTNAPNQTSDNIERPAPARFPDYLMNERQINIEKGKLQSVWLTIKIPEDAPAGTYYGTIAINTAQDRQSMPIVLKVYPLTIPSERHLKIAVRFVVNNFDKYHGIKEKYSDEWFTMLAKYAENMVEHRQNVMQASFSTIGITRTGQGDLQFDFTRFDQIVQVFLKTGKFDFIETGYGMTKFGEDDWFSTVIELSDFTVKDSSTGEAVTLKGSDVVPYLLPAFERHLREKGWLEKTLLSVRNEPSVHNSENYKELSDYFHTLAPDLKQFESIETTEFGGLNIPGPKLDHLATWYEKFKEAQDNGTEVCYYIVGIYQGSRFPDKTIDLPIMDSRIMPWLNYKYNLSGIKHWGWNSWTDDPFNEVGQHLGDGWHVYPIKNGILNSLRWEQMRNGIQDYECFWMLENRIRILKDSLGSRFSWIDPRQRSVEITGEAVKNFAERTNDPAVLYKAKEQVINEILKFNDSPEVYVQTNPAAGSELTAGSSIEVYGWTEPGTKITVNRKELPVSENGLFLEQFSLSARNNKIIVTAFKGDKSKEIVREFIVR